MSNDDYTPTPYSQTHGLRTEPTAVETIGSEGSTVIENLGEHTLTLQLVLGPGDAARVLRNAEGKFDMLERGVVKDGVFQRTFDDGCPACEGQHERSDSCVFRDRLE